MNSKNIKNNLLQYKNLEPLNGVDTCEVSRASVEIMLERFSNGKEIDFPFSHLKN